MEGKAIEVEEDVNFEWISKLPVTSTCFGERMRWHVESRGTLSEADRENCHNLLYFGEDYWVPYFSIANDTSHFDSVDGMVTCVAIHPKQTGVYCSFIRNEPKTPFMAVGLTVAALSLVQKQGKKQMVHLCRSGKSQQEQQYPSMQFLKETLAIGELTVGSMAVFPGTDVMAMTIARFAGYIFGMFSTLKFVVFKDGLELLKTLKDADAKASENEGDVQSWAVPQDLYRASLLLSRIEDFLEPEEAMSDLLHQCGVKMDEDGGIAMPISESNDFCSKEPLAHSSSSCPRRISFAEGTRSSTVKTVPTNGLMGSRSKSSHLGTISEVDEEWEEDEEEEDSW